eukprot:1789346-Prymnesium_polylepis.1
MTRPLGAEPRRSSRQSHNSGRTRHVPPGEEAERRPVAERSRSSSGAGCTSSSASSRDLRALAYWA